MSGTRGTLALIVNPSAGGGRSRRTLERVRNELASRGMDHTVHLTEGLDDGGRAALEAAARGETPVVLSGDGLVGHVAGVLAGSGRVMGVLPGGRGNDFARVLGIPRDPVGAVAVLEAGHIREVDVGVVNDSRFVGVASAGFDSDANTIANEARLVRGPLVYLYAALRALAAWKPATFTLDVDGSVTTFRGYSVAIANSKAFGGGMFIAPDAVLDDGLLDVVLIHDISKLRYLRGLPKVFKGAHIATDSVSVQRGSRVTLDADRPFAVYADGDPLAELPATVSLLPRALRVLAPAP